MGAVYEAEDTQLGNRKVALKEMRQSGLSPQEITDAANAFRQEALMLAGLQNPHLPSIYDHFSEFNRWYLIMSFIHGETLEAYLNKANGGKLPLEETLQIGIQLCTVLGYLHSQQPPIIFRDLKPSNIMRAPDGHIYLIDFGIARLFKRGQARDTAVYGSKGYASPEQYGRAQTTPQSDIYSLGAVLHQLLSGHHPTSTPFRFPPLQMPDQAFPMELVTLIEQMLNLDESNRPVSILAVKQKLQSIAATLVKPLPLPPTVPVPPPQKITPVRKLSRRTVITGLAAVGVVAVGGGITWWVMSPHPLYTYRGSAGPVAWSPDGKRIASGGDDDTVQVWDAADGGNLYTYREHSGGVESVAWSPDGKHIASGGDDNTVRVWDAADGGNLYTYRGHSNAVWSVAWSPDGKRIASGGLDKTVQVWDATDGGNLYTYRGHSSGVYSVAWSPNGKRIASGGLDKTVQVWDVADGGNLYTYRGHSASVYSVAWSPDGKRIASGGDDDTIRVWDAADGGNLYTYRGHSTSVYSVAWSPDSKRIASGGDDDSVQVWDATNGGNLYTYRGHSASVYSVAWSRDGKRIASGGVDKTVQVWEAR